MTVVSSHVDTEGLTMTVVSEFDASLEEVWHVWEDPRLLERWWGPPTWPATFERYEFEVGGRSNYYMTGPEGEKERGWWRLTAIDAPRHLEFDDGFADENGDPNPSMEPTHTAVTLEPAGNTTRVTSLTTFVSDNQLEQLIDMGMEEGMREATEQIDDILAETR
jgi:uncharacterized protein YndB with AHSA1/START domain